MALNAFTVSLFMIVGLFQGQVHLKGSQEHTPGLALGLDTNPPHATSIHNPTHPVNPHRSSPPLRPALSVGPARRPPPRSPRPQVAARALRSTRPLLQVRPSARLIRRPSSSPVLATTLLVTKPPFWLENEQVAKVLNLFILIFSERGRGWVWARSTSSARGPPARSSSRRCPSPPSPSPSSAGSPPGPPPPPPSPSTPWPPPVRLGPPGQHHEGSVWSRRGSVDGARQTHLDRDQKCQPYLSLVRLSGGLGFCSKGPVSVSIFELLQPSDVCFLFGESAAIHSTCPNLLSGGGGEHLRGRPQISIEYPGA